MVENVFESFHFYSIDAFELRTDETGTIGIVLLGWAHCRDLRNSKLAVGW